MAALLFDVDEGRPPALDRAACSRLRNCSANRWCATSEANIKTSSGLKPCGETVVDVRIFLSLA